MGFYRSDISSCIVSIKPPYRCLFVFLHIAFLALTYVDECTVDFSKTEKTKRHIITFIKASVVRLRVIPRSMHGCMSQLQQIGEGVRPEAELVGPTR